MSEYPTHHTVGHFGDGLSMEASVIGKY